MRTFTREGEAQQRTRVFVALEANNDFGQQATSIARLLNATVLFDEKRSRQKRRS